MRGSLALFTEAEDGSTEFVCETTLDAFIADNEMEDGERAEIEKELERDGRSVFGGGAAPLFVLIPVEAVTVREQVPTAYGKPPCYIGVTETGESRILLATRELQIGERVLLNGRRVVFGS